MHIRRDSTNTSTAAAGQRPNTHERRPSRLQPAVLLICLPLLVSCLLYQRHTEVSRRNHDDVYLTKDPLHQSLDPQEAPPLLSLDIPMEFRSNPNNTDIDALVFIAIGPAATAPVLGWSVHSAVQVGGWNGPVYIVTDKPEAVRKTLLQNYNRGTAAIPTAAQLLLPENWHILAHEHALPHFLSSFNDKLTKCQLLDILPKHLQHIVYIENDIMIGRPLAPFWKSVAQVWIDPQEEEEDRVVYPFDDDVSLHEDAAAYRDLVSNGIEQQVSIGLFEDVKSYTAGWVYCKDCDTWNTGVMSIRRGRSERCLKAWCDTLKVVGGTDQAALDTVISAGSECQNIQALDLQHVRMMKDIFVVAGLVGTKTFNHFTGIFRPQNLSTLHRRFYERVLWKKLTFNTPTPSLRLMRDAERTTQ